MNNNKTKSKKTHPYLHNLNLIKIISHFHLRLLKNYLSLPHPFIFLQHTQNCGLLHLHRILTDKISAKSREQLLKVTFLSLSLFITVTHIFLLIS